MKMVSGTDLLGKVSPLVIALFLISSQLISNFESILTGSSIVSPGRIGQLFVLVDGICKAEFYSL